MDRTRDGALGAGESFELFKFSLRARLLLVLLDVAWDAGHDSIEFCGAVGGAEEAFVPGA